MKKVRTRDEIKETDKWDLTVIYKNDKAWYNDLKEVQSKVPKIEDFKGKIVDNASHLLEFLTFDTALERKIFKLYYYAHLKHDEDTSNTTYQKMQGEIEELLKEKDEISAFVTPEMMKADYSKIKEYYNENNQLKEYEFMLENFYRRQKYTLSEEGEKLISSLSRLIASPEDTYEALTDADLTFGNIVVDGEEVELTESNYGIYIRSKDRSVRKAAFEKLFETYSRFKNTIASTFSGNVKALCELAKIRGYKNSLEASLFSDHIDRKVYDNLIDTVHKHLDVLFKYYRLKKDILKLDEFHLYDTYVSIVKKSDQTYSFSQAKEIVLEALSILGEDYIQTLNKAFDERWIDIYPNRGKRGGAYSSGFYDTNPYVLLNFEGTFRDVSTLAHELGHSVHTYYSCKNNSYQNSSYKIFVAEVASTVNELLLIKHLLKKTSDKEEKKYLLNELMDLFKSTIYRQVMFAEFERNMHEKKEKGEILTNELLSEDYYNINKVYFGPDVVCDNLIRYEWERIPHFYYDFYVYKYAIGLSAACHIVEGILSGKEGALENYLKFLSLGGSMYPAEELKIAGVDVLDSSFVESAIGMFNEVIEEFKKICDE